MSFKKIGTIFIAGLFVALPGLAQAQISNLDHALAPQGAEVRLSFIIPFGQSADKSKTAPRLGFALRNYKQSSRPSTDWMLAVTEPYREVRLGFTFEDTPQLMMNDKILVLSEDEQANIGTAGKIGLGVLAAALVSVVVIGALIIDCATDTTCDEE